MRDGRPLPGLTPEELLSQLAYRTLGPMHPRRVHAVLDYHGLRGHPAINQDEIAARYGVTTRTVTGWVTTVNAAGRRLPLAPDLVSRIVRRSGVDEDHLGRTRVALTFGLPRPRRARPVPPATPPPTHRAAAKSAIAVLATVGPLPLPDLAGAVRRSRQYRDRPPITDDELAVALQRLGARPDNGGCWEAPPQSTAPQRHVAIAAALQSREIRRSELTDLLIHVGYAPASASGLITQTHPLIRHVGPDRYRLIGPD